jgi:hypothetical protein
MSVDAGDSGQDQGGLDFDFDVSLAEDQTQSTGEQGTEQESSASGIKRNPAWNPLFEALPKPFHSLAEPVLQQWDQGVQKKFREYQEQIAPFKPIIDQKLDPNDLVGAYGLVQQMNENPLEFFERFKQLLIQQGLYQEAAEVQAAQEQAEATEEFRDPRVDELQKQQEAFLQQIAAQQQAEAQAQAQQQMQEKVASEMEFIRSKVGNIPDWLEVEIYDRAALMTQREQRPVSLVEAYQELQSFRQNILSVPRPGAQAPRVIPAGGGYPQPQIDRESLKTEDGRLEAIKATAARLGGNG